MAKNIVIRKHRDKIVLRKDGDVFADIVVANSSRTESVNLSIESPPDVEIQKQRR